MSGITLWRWDKITKSDFIFLAETSLFFVFLVVTTTVQQTKKKSHRTVKVQEIFIAVVYSQRQKRKVIAHAHTGR